MNTKISIATTQEILDTLVSKNIFLSCGYGGVMFAEIGTIEDRNFEYEKGKPTTRKYGEYRLFCDENWCFSDGKTIRFDRWTCSMQEVDDLLESIGIQKLEKVEIINNFEKISFHISGGHTFTIIRDDSISTFSIVFIPEKKKLTVFGNGNVKFENYEEDMKYLKMKPRPKRMKTIPIDKDFLRDQIPDLLPISLEKAKELIQPVLNERIQAIEINSGTQFTLCLGEDYRRFLPKKDQKNWSSPMYGWSLSIDEMWILKKANEIVIDVRKERFHFEKKLLSLLNNKQILKISFDNKDAKTQIIFSDEYSLSVLDTNRYSSWSMYNRQTGVGVGSNRNQGLTYRISTPIHLFDTYQTGEIHLDAILYELKFYRDYFADDNK